MQSTQTNVLTVSPNNDMHSLLIDKVDNSSELGLSTTEASLDIVKSGQIEPRVDQSISLHPCTVSHGLEQDVPLTGDMGEVIIDSPPETPVDKLGLINLPHTLDASKLPVQERSMLNIFGKAKDALVGGNVKEPYRALYNNIAAFNKLVAPFNESLEALKEATSDLANGEDFSTQLSDTREKLSALKEAVKQIRVAHRELSTCDLEEAGQNIVEEMGVKAKDFEEQIVALEKAIDDIERAENEGRAQWRTEISSLQEEIELKPELEGKKPTTDDLVWLNQLQRAIGKDKQPVTETDVANALVKLMKGGANFPKDINTTVALLSAFYPNPEAGKVKGEKIQTVEELVEYQSKSLGEGEEVDKTDTVSKQYAALLKEKQELLKERDNTLHYLNVLLKANKLALSELPKDISGIKSSKEFGKAVKYREQCLMALQNFYQLAWRDNSKKLEGKSLATFETIRDRAPESVREALNSAIELAKQRAQIHATHEGRTDHGDGHITLLAQATGTTVNRDKVNLDEDDFEPEDLLLLDGALDEYGEIESLSDQTRLKLHARECMQLQHQLGYYSQGENFVHDPVHGFESVDFQSDHVKDYLFRDFRKNPQEYTAFLAKRSELLDAYIAKLGQVIGDLPEGTDTIKEPLLRELNELKAERTIVAALLEASEPLSVIDGLEHNLSIQKDQAKIINKELISAKKPFDDKLANINLKVYQLRQGILQDNIQKTRELALEKAELQNRRTELEEALVITYDGSLEDILNDPSVQVSDLYEKYNQLLIDQQENLQAIDTLNKEFRVGLLELQKEEQRAKGIDGGGYPEDVSWGSWLAKKAGEQVGEWAGINRKTPQSMLLERQLALSGKTMAEAYSEMVGLLYTAMTDPTQAGSVLEQLGFTPSQLKAWAEAYPDEMRQLSGNINHAYNALSSSGTGLGQQVKDLFNNAWQRGTTENMVKDALLGDREDIVGAVDPKPMPPAMLALLNIADWAPYVAGAYKGLNEQNIGGMLGGIVGTAALGTVGFPAIAGTAVLKMALGGMQVQVEKGLAQEVTKRRDLEVMVNGVLTGLQTSGGISERLEAVAKYTLQRQALKEVGTVVRDTVEVGKLGAVARYREELSLWWNKASTGQKAVLVAATVGMTVAAGAVVFGALAAGPLGVTVAAVLGILAMLGSASLTRGLWNSLGPLLGMEQIRKEVQNDMNKKRLDTALVNARKEMKAQLAKTKIQLQSDQLKLNKDQEQLQEEALQLATKELEAIRDKVLRDNPGATEEQIERRFIKAVQTYQDKGIPPLSSDHDTLISKVDTTKIKSQMGSSYDDEMLRECVMEVDKILLNQVSAATD